MVAECDAIGPGAEQLIANSLGDTKAAGGVFAIDHDKIEFPFGAQAGQLRGYRSAAGAAQNITDKEKAHKSFLNKDEALLAGKVCSVMRREIPKFIVTNLVALGSNLAYHKNKERTQ